MTEANVQPVEKFAPKVAAVLVIDMQNDFCHPDGIMAKRGFDVTGLPAMVARLEHFLEAARRHLVPVIWVRTTHDDTTNSPVWLARHSTTLRAEKPPEMNCWTGTWGADFWGVIPPAGEPVVTKHRYSAFAGTSLDWVLRSLERQSLLITGVSTEACVESTVRDGFFHEFHVNLVEDCCASYSQERHNETVINVRTKFGLVANSADIIAQWKGEDAHPAPTASTMQP
jgi:nicotinamidase-related amidase